MRVFEIRDTRGIESIKLTERPVPQPESHQVLIRIRAVSLNRSDLSVTRGSYGRNTPLPLVLCSDGVGEIVDVGRDVSRVRTGERVSTIFMPKWLRGPITEGATREAVGRTLDGNLAEYVVANEESVVRPPANLTDEEAATLPTAAVTAWNGLVSHGNLQQGESVLTLGTGGVSVFAVQFALQKKARVISTSGDTEKLDTLRKMGAMEAIDYRTVPDWSRRVREITDGGVDHVVEVVGAATLEQSLRAVRAGGRISLIGALGGAGEVNPIPIVMKSISVQGIYVGSREMFEAMNEFILSNDLKPVIDRTFEFTEAIEAFRYLESGRHFGKICIRVG